MNSTYTNLVKLYELMVIQSYAKEQEKTKRSKTRTVKIGTSLCCLVCRGQDNLVKLRYEPDVNTTTQDVLVENYIEMIFTCFNIEIKDEEGGGCICEVCIERLRDALDFKKRLEEAENILLLHINDDMDADNINTDELVADEGTKPKKSSKNKDQEIEIMPPRLKPGTNQCPVCKEFNFNFPALKTHYMAHFQPSYECAQCGKRFLTKKKLSDHMRIFHKYRPQICQMCGKSYSSLQLLERHITNVHQSSKVYTCDYCPLSFLTSNEKRKHKTVLHKEQLKKHACHICNKEFLEAGKLRNHIQSVHMGFRVFHCPQCDYRATTQNSLNKHISTHNVPSFPCTMCTRKFKSEKFLLDHVKIHTNKTYKCDYCESTFAQTRSLAVHMMKAHNIDQKEAQSKKDQEELLIKMELSIQ